MKRMRFATYRPTICSIAILSPFADIGKRWLRMAAGHSSSSLASMKCCDCLIPRQQFLLHSLQHSLYSLHFVKGGREEREQSRAARKRLTERDRILANAAEVTQLSPTIAFASLIYVPEYSLSQGKH